jgi:hypothetical protein
MANPSVLIIPTLRGVAWSRLGLSAQPGTPGKKGEILSDHLNKIKMI